MLCLSLTACVVLPYGRAVLGAMLMGCGCVMLETMRLVIGARSFAFLRDINALTMLPAS